MKKLLRSLLSQRTRNALYFDYLRLRARLRNQRRRDLVPPQPRLHFGCGRRHIEGWTNVDVAGSPFDLDLGAPLPWRGEVFDAIVSQQVIEHLDLKTELLPLFRELARTTKPGAEIWLSCPDLAKVCASYVENGGEALKADRESRWGVDWMEGMPTSQIVNILFHQGNEHKNLYDLALLSWALERTGFSGVERQTEADFLARFPEFPERRDDFHALYVRARRAV
jgi:predicted SAM-dependent methyltransferase